MTAAGRRRSCERELSLCFHPAPLIQAASCDEKAEAGQAPPPATAITAAQFLNLTRGLVRRTPPVRQFYPADGSALCLAALLDPAAQPCQRVSICCGRFSPLSAAGLRLQSGPFQPGLPPCRAQGRHWLQPQARKPRCATLHVRLLRPRPLPCAPKRALSSTVRLRRTLIPLLTSPPRYPRHRRPSGVVAALVRWFYSLPSVRGGVEQLHAAWRAPPPGAPLSLCPSLFIYSTADLLIDFTAVEAFAAQRESAGVEVHRRRFDDAPHVALLRRVRPRESSGFCLSGASAWTPAEESFGRPMTPVHGSCPTQQQVVGNEGARSAEATAYIRRMFVCSQAQPR